MLCSLLTSFGQKTAMKVLDQAAAKFKVAGSLTAGVEYILRSTKTGETLYHREGLISLDTSVNSNNGGLLGALVDLAATAITTSATDKVEAGRRCTRFVLSDMPEGKYGLNYDKDQKMAAGSSYVQAVVR